ncbi:hypothetical protein BV898_04464 [Hypsibius exemplaris]|uniref:G-protein coupled receptors family 1 profile domain-containing protein n=1 Tax=Hypsibius exemplaris TaxID=2072580 RepID=A0A1W0X2J4_HYPEX|nr:hypothetical protein BV898_04464 [Hypsibius exemplaris]
MNSFANSSNASAWNHSTNGLTLAVQRELLACIITTTIFSVIGTVTNFLALVVTWPTRANKLGLNLLIFNFVAVNLAMCAVANPLNVYAALANRLGYTTTLRACRYINTPFSLLVYVINFTDVGLTVNRCCALFFPHQYKRWTAKHINVIILVAVWVFSVGVSCPAAFGYGGRPTVNSLGGCNFLPDRPLLRVQIVFGYAPYVIAGVGSLMILYKCYGMSRRNRVAVQQSSTRHGPSTRYGPSTGDGLATRYGSSTRHGPSTRDGLSTRDGPSTGDGLATRYGPSTGDGLATRDGSSTRHRRVLLERLKMAKMMLVLFLWGLLCLIPWGVITSVYPSLLASDPVSYMWIRAALGTQYGLTPCILLVCNRDYREKLSKIFKGDKGSPTQETHNSVSMRTRGWKCTTISKNAGSG